jgi:hypothetical protein
MPSQPVDAMTDEELDRLIRWIRETDRPELGQSLSVPTLPAGQLAFGPNIPVIGMRQFQQLPSGLIVPEVSERRLDKLFGGFAMTSDFLGEPVPLAELVDALTSLNVEPLIGNLLAMNAILEQRGISPALSEELLLACCPPPVVTKLRPLIHSRERAFTSPQVLLTLTKLVLAASRGTDDLELTRIGPLILTVADHVGGDVQHEDEDWALELTRYGWFNFRDRQQLLWGRFQRLWREVIPSLSSHPKFIDPAEVIERGIGIDYASFLALGVGLSAYFEQRVRNDEPPLWLREEIQGTVLPRETVARFVSAMSADRDWYAEGVLESLNDPVLFWDFTKMRQRPLLRHNGGLIPFSLQMLAERVTDGLFYTVADALGADSAEASARWRDFFGVVWETYVHELIVQGVGDRARIIPESLMVEAWPNVKTCDNVIEYPSRFLLIEAVARRFSLDTVAIGDIDDLEEDLRKAALIKARQLASTVRLLSKRSTDLETRLGHSIPVGPATRFTPVIVLPGPFPQLPFVTGHVNELLRDDPECGILGVGRVDGIVFLAAGDLEILVGTAASMGQTLPDLLDAWQGSDLNLMDFRTWAANSIPGGAYIPDWLMNGAHEGIRWASRVLYRSGGPE